MENQTRGAPAPRKAAGAAALYLAAAYAAAIVFYLGVVGAASGVDPASKVESFLRFGGGLYAMNLAGYVAFGLALAVLSVALHGWFRAGAPAAAAAVLGIGLVWACLLAASGSVSNMGMEAVLRLHASDPGRAALVWQAIEPVAEGLGGGSGEAVGGPWVLLVGLAGLRSKRLPGVLSWIGVGIGAVGLASILPPLRDAAVVFGLLQIPWLVWLGILLLRTDRGASAA